jgi:hypothetical protein
LIWLGNFIAFHGPSGFQTLWGLLRPAAEHYIYAHDAGEQQMRAAHNSLYAYGEKLEEFIIAGVVSIICRLTNAYCTFLAGT